ncbi:DUF6612 family protein [Lactobacillus kitasatonis]|uniref:Lipoprotein n=1 Tax=Lactobacillus kitasatonis DSM 16761 = JCM 1039 TaxID=1423767 RepID=A0A0R1VF86_9LACO|nr:DUF6612 family protein [Lactobacillus kitasatonis]KRM04248.1 hypothetical protein FC59_GL000999 [Lactobacillus kitasatonis DSM 16761 = JCM 1039]
MVFKNKKFIIGLIGIFVLLLAGCSTNKTTTKKENTLQSAKTILTKAQKTKFDSMHATWDETENGATIQKAEVQYVNDPTVIYANVAAASNHYKMWIEGKTSYIQMKGTSSNHWFKTKLGKSNSYTVLTDSLNNMLDPFVATSKSFKVKPNGNDYALSYKGNNKKIWNAIVSDSAITVLIGIDLDNVKPINNEILIDVDNSYHITDVKVVSTYKDEGTNRTFTMNADQIDQIKHLEVPANVKKGAVDLGKMSKSN